MKGLPNEERQRLGALLDHTSQAEVMARIPQFSKAELYNPVPPPARAPEALGALVFNMERGVCLTFWSPARRSGPLTSSWPTSWTTAASAPGEKTPPWSWRNGWE